MEGVLTGDSDDKRESPLGERDGLDKFCESFGARLAADLRNGLFFLPLPLTDIMIEREKIYNDVVETLYTKTQTGMTCAMTIVTELQVGLTRK